MEKKKLNIFHYFIKWKQWLHRQATWEKIGNCHFSDHSWIFQVLLDILGLGFCALVSCVTIKYSSCKYPPLLPCSPSLYPSLLPPLLFFFGNLKDTEYKELKGRHSYFYHWQTLFIFCFIFSQFSSYEYMFKEITLLYDYSVFFYFYFVY